MELVVCPPLVGPGVTSSSGALFVGACRGWGSVPFALAHCGRRYGNSDYMFESLACCCDALLCGWDWVGQRVLIPVPPRLSAWVFVSLAQAPLASSAHVLMPSHWSFSAGEFLPAFVLCSLASKTPRGQVRSDPRMMLFCGCDQGLWVYAT